MNRLIENVSEQIKNWEKGFIEEIKRKDKIIEELKKKLNENKRSSTIS